MADLAKQARDAVKKYGTVSEAARQLGVPRSTLRSRLETSAEAKPGQDVVSLKRELQASQKTIERLELSIDRMKAVDKKRIFKPLREKGKKGDFIRVAIPDTHGMFVDQAAVNTMLGDLKSLDVGEVVYLGDHLDCGGFLAQHHVLNYQAELQYSYEQDVEAANQFLDSVEKTCNTKEKYYLEGNHCSRVEKWIVTATLRNPADSHMLYKTLGPQSVLHVEDRHIKYIAQKDFHMGLRTRGTIKLGKCHFTHGTNAARHSAARHAQQFAGCVVHGHIHREQSDMIAPVAVGQVGAWCPGCLCTLQPMYRHTCPSNWTHGYAIQFVRADGEFLHLNIPIVDGKSFLGPLLDLIT